LSIVGESQARLTGDYLTDVNFDVVVCSDLQRTRQTCGHILECATNQPTVHYDPLLREICFGEMEGQHYEDFQRFAHENGYEKPNSWLAPFPGRETIESVKRRAMQSFQLIERLVAEKLSSPEKQKLSSSCTNSAADDLPVNVLLVSHGGFIRNLTMYLSLLTDLDEEIAKLHGDNTEKVNRAKSNGTVMDRYLDGTFYIDLSVPNCAINLCSMDLNHHEDTRIITTDDSTIACGEQQKRLFRTGSLKFIKLKDTGHLKLPDS